MSDGSVRFISDSIDTGNQAVFQGNTGPSMYGVWGALGSINGGEVNNLVISNLCAKALTVHAPALGEVRGALSIRAFVRLMFKEFR